MYIGNELDEKVRRTANLFPWYAAMAGPLNGHAKKLRLEELPLMTAEVLEEHYYTPDQPFGGRPDLCCYQTSGTSSNRRKSIYYSERDEEQYIRIKTEVLESILKGSQAAKAMADMGTGHAASTAETVFHRLALEVETVSFRLPIEQHLERFAAFRPDVLYTMPSILDRILMASSDPAAYGIRKVIVVGEVASLSWQRRAAERMGIDASDITDTYGSIEIGTIAKYDHELKRYILTEGLIAEGLKAEEVGAEADALAEDERVLVLTSIVREPQRQAGTVYDSRSDSPRRS